MKMAATASYRAVPSMLTVAPTGSTKRVTRLSIPQFSSRQRNVIGNVAALQAEQPPDGSHSGETERGARGKKVANREIKNSRNQEIKKSRNREIKKSRNQEIKKSTNQQINKSTNQQINKSTNQQINKSTNQQINKSTNQSINQSTNQTINQSLNQSINQSTNQAVDHSVDQSVNQATNQSSINQYSIQPINQSPHTSMYIHHSFNHSVQLQIEFMHISYQTIIVFQVLVMTWSRFYESSQAMPTYRSYFD